MKKFFLMAVAVLGSAFCVNAQDVVTPEAGDFSVEVQFNPFSNNFETFKVENLQLQGRYFFSNKDAIRFGIGFGVDTQKQNDAVTNTNEWTKTRKGNFAINAGYERHFFNFKRVDLYAGAGLAFSLQNLQLTEQSVDEDATYKHVIGNYSSNDESTYNEFAAKVFTGVDFYVYKGLYLGAELGIKVGVKNFPGSYEKGRFTDNGNWDESNKFNEAPISNSFVLSTYVEPALRLGWTF